jgi:hypothetical protein
MRGGRVVEQGQDMHNVEDGQAGGLLDRLTVGRHVRALEDECTDLRMRLDQAYCDPDVLVAAGLHIQRGSISQDRPAEL